MPYTLADEESTRGMLHLVLSPITGFLAGISGTLKHSDYLRLYNIHKSTYPSIGQLQNDTIWWNGTSKWGCCFKQPFESPLGYLTLGYQYQSVYLILVLVFKVHMDAF